MEVAAVKSHRDITLPVPGVPQCPLSGEVTEGIHPLIKESLDEGDPIQHKDIVTRLLTAIQSPAAVAVIKCKAHTNADDLISRGNALAEEAAEAVVLDTPPQLLCMAILAPLIDHTILIALQKFIPTAAMVAHQGSHTLL